MASHSIEKLLQHDKVDAEANTSFKSTISDEVDVTSNLSFSDNDDQSDNDKSSPPSPPSRYMRKYDRRHKSRVPEELRLRVNGRERQRMHDITSALDSLRQVMPRSHGPSVKTISKMATLELARNYILMLNKSYDEMRKLVGDLTTKQTTNAQVHTSPAAVPPIGQHILSSHLPYHTNVTKSPLVYSSDLQQHISLFPSPQMPYKMEPLYPVAGSGHALRVSVPCACNLCQTSLASFPKSGWKQTC